MSWLIWAAASLWAVVGWIVARRRLRASRQSTSERIGLEEDLLLARFRFSDALARHGPGSAEAEWWESQVRYFEREIERR